MFLNQSSDFFLLSHQPGEKFSLSGSLEFPIIELGKDLEAITPHPLPQALGRAFHSLVIHSH